LGCEDATVYNDSFLDYYLIDGGKFFTSKTMLFADRGLNLHLINTSGKVYVITASEDTVVPNTYRIVKGVISAIPTEKNIKLYQVDGADHFFRDFYFDDLMAIITERTN
jgi:alpha/beta superfamily hydrolase